MRFWNKVFIKHSNHAYLWFVNLSFILNEFCSRFVMVVPFILPTVRRSSVGSFLERDFFDSQISVHRKFKKNN
jgi:hypothetical protein